MTLSQLQPGQSAVIASLNNLDMKTRKKLMVMGILPQSNIKLIRIAPMGDPMQIEVRGISLAIRKQMAAKIELEKA